MRCFSLLLVSLAFACGPADDVIDITYDPCSSLTIASAPGNQASEIESIEAAIETWSHVIPTAIEVGPWTEDRSALAIRFESGDTFYRAVYWDQVGEISISREHIDSADYPVAIAHELGHAFGLRHIAERPSVMNQGNLEIAPNGEDALAIAALWASCASP